LCLNHFFVAHATNGAIFTHGPKFDGRLPSFSRETVEIVEIWQNISSIFDRIFTARAQKLLHHQLLW